MSQPVNDSQFGNSILAEAERLSYLNKKEEFRWSFRKKGTYVLNICTRLLFIYGFAAAVSAGFATSAQANPAGGTVVGGAATITNSGTTETINQSSQNTIINWNSFNIAKGETTDFVQPNSSAIALNRVYNTQQMSTIYGNLKANGRVIIMNPNGVLIGKSGNVNTAGFIATSADIANGEFMTAANNKAALNFNIAGKSTAAIINKGTVTVKKAGIAAFVAPTVRNDGIIQGKLSKIQLGAADTFGVDLYGDGLLSLAVGENTHKLSAENKGTIIADGGDVLMTAAAARNAVDSVINNKGVIEATTYDEKNGSITLEAPGEDGTVKVSGTLDAKGGTIETSADKVNVTPTAKIRAKQWTVDPLSIQIGGSSTTSSVISTAALDGELNSGGNVTIQTNGVAGPGQDNSGNIIIADTIAKTAGSSATLNLDATGSVEFVPTSGGILSNSGALNVNLKATNGAIDVSQAINTNGGAVTVNSPGTIFLANTITTEGGAVTIASNDKGIGSGPGKNIITDGGAVSVSAGTYINLAGDINSGAGEIRLTAGHNGTGNAEVAGVTSTSGNITIGSATGSTILDKDISSTSGKINVNTHGAITAKNISTTDGGILLTSGNGGSITAGNLFINSTDGNVNPLTVNSAGAINLGNVSVANSGATSGSGSEISLVAANGNLTAGDVSINNLATTGDSEAAVTITANNGAINTGNLTVNSNSGSSPSNGSMLTVNASDTVNVNGNVSVNNVDSGDPSQYSSAVASITAQNDVNISGTSTVTSFDHDMPWIGSTSILSVNSVNGGVNMGGAVNLTSNANMNGPGAADLPSVTNLAITANKDIVIGGPITTNSASVTSADAGSTESSSSRIFVSSTNGNLSLAGAGPSATANSTTTQVTYTGAAVDQTNTSADGADVSRVILSGSQPVVVTPPVGPVPQTVGAFDLTSRIQQDVLNRPIISMADKVINYDAPFEPVNTAELNTDLSIKTAQVPATGTVSPTTNLANLEPAAGGDSSASVAATQNQSVQQLANLEPAAGGGPVRNTDVVCANDFLDNHPCVAR